jgi:hypothetical protein
MSTTLHYYMHGKVLVTWIFLDVVYHGPIQSGDLENLSQIGLNITTSFNDIVLFVTRNVVMLVCSMYISLFDLSMNTIKLTYSEIIYVAMFIPVTRMKSDMGNIR